MNSKFVTIQNEALARAEKVECSRDSYHRGLVAMYHTLKEAIETEDIDPHDPDMNDDSDDDEDDDD